MVDRSTTTAAIVLAFLAWATPALVAPVAGEPFLTGDVRLDIATSPARTTCLDRAEGADLAMAGCEAGETALWDRRLNAAYARLRTTLPPVDFADLQAAQRAWIAYRAAACRDSGRAGTAGRVSAADCALALTAVRAAEMEAKAR